MFENFCSILNLGIKIKKTKVKIKKSKNVLVLLKILFSLGYIKGFLVNENYINIWINSKMFSLRGIFLVSKKGNRKYISYKKIPRLLNGILLLSTTKGIITSFEASYSKVGGEVLMYIC